MQDILDKLVEVEALLKHQPGKHDQGKHAGSRGGDSGPAKAATSHADAGKQFMQAMRGASKVSAPPGSGRGKFETTYRMSGNKVAKAAETIKGLGYEEYEDDSKSASTASFRNGNITAHVRHSSGANQTRVTFVDRSKSKIGPLGNMQD
jgi:hypothetical protein